MNKHRISQYSTRKNPALAIPPSSILLRTDESGNLLDSKKILCSSAACNSVGTSLLNHDNTVGIIGGLSINSTLIFLKKLVQWGTKEGDDCPPFVLCSNPALSKSEGVQMDRAPMENLRHERVFLEKSGARVKTDVYQEKLRSEKQGFEVLLPDKATIEHAVIPAVEAFKRKDMEGAQNLLRIALQVLLVRAVNTVILVSDDMLELLPHDDSILQKCMDPLDALARSTIKWSLSAR